MVEAVLRDQRDQSERMVRLTAVLLSCCVALFDVIKAHVRAAVKLQERWLFVIALLEDLWLWGRGFVRWRWLRGEMGV